MVRPAVLRHAVDYAVQAHRISERRACLIVGQARSSQRRKLCPRPGVEEASLKAQIQAACSAHPQAGYRRVYRLLVQRGVDVGLRRVVRLYRALGLSLRVKRKRRLKVTARVPMQLPQQRNEVWAMDFVSDAIAAEPSRPFRTFAAIDVCSRQMVAYQVATSLPSGEVTRVLEDAIKRHGKPKAIRCDNGPEFRSKHFVQFAARLGIDVQYIQPGKPIENAFAESFNGRFRAECLNANWFTSLAQARRIIADWMRHYNEERPHSSLGYLTPNDFALTQTQAA